jgi:ArsR family transcriptional regulator, virulence genes transcriptional regulator
VIVAPHSISQPTHKEGTGPSIDKAAALLASLANAVRLGAILRLTQREWSVNELAADLNISQSALSQHLGKLRNANVVRVRRDRQTVYYHCSDATVQRLLTELGLAR